MPSLRREVEGYVGGCGVNNQTRHLLELIVIFGASVVILAALAMFSGLSTEQFFFILMLAR